MSKQHQPSAIPPATVADCRVEDVSQLRPTLRSGLVFSRIHEGGEPCYTVEDPVRGQFFRVGDREYRLMKLLDGQRTVEQAVAELATIEPMNSLRESEAVIVCDWLIRSQLATVGMSNNAVQMSSMEQRHGRQKRLANWNPLCFKIPLGRPDAMVSKLTPVLGWIFGRLVGWASVGAIAIAAMMVLPHSTRFFASAQETFVPNRWWVLLLVWLGLKFVHETAHAVVCRRHGGRVAEAGLMMVFFAPLAYVDLTSAWRFKSKWARIHTAIAGMQVELLIASIAAIAWVHTQDGTFHTICHHVVILAGLTTLLFNANPLMRFDGYYVLSDFLEIPNLYSDSTAYLRYLGKRFLLGEPVSTALHWDRRGLFVRCYAIAALIWRIMVCVSLIVAAAFLWNGLGVMVSVIAALLWLVLPLLKFAKYLRRPDGFRSRRLARFALSVGIVGGILTIGLCRVRWPGADVVAAVISDESSRPVRVLSEGFIAQVLVTPGQLVEAGQPLARLENLQLRVELADLELAIEQSELKSRVWKQKDELHSFQAEQDQLAALIEKRRQKQKEVGELTIRATTNGQIIARSLMNRVGTYLKKGDVLLTIAKQADHRVRVMIPMRHHERFEDAVGQPVMIRLAGGVTLPAKIASVDPRATSQATDPSMYAINGGMLAHRRSDESESSSRDDQELLQPHFSAIAEIDVSDQHRVRPGQRGVLTAPGQPTTVSTYLSESVQQTVTAWMKSKTQG